MYKLSLADNFKGLFLNCVLYQILSRSQITEIMMC